MAHFGLGGQSCLEAALNVGNPITPTAATRIMRISRELAASYPIGSFDEGLLRENPIYREGVEEERTLRLTVAGMPSDVCAFNTEVREEEGFTDASQTAPVRRC